MCGARHELAHHFKRERDHNAEAQKGVIVEA